MIKTMDQWDVYMSGALTNLPPQEYKRITTKIYDRVMKISQSMELNCYCPHRSPTTPSKGIVHSKVWKTDYGRVVGAGAVVAYIGIPALGVGAEIEMARTANVPVVLLCETSRQEGLSRLILGNPSVVDIILFEDPSEFEKPLRKLLFHIFSNRNLDSAALEKNWTVSTYRRYHQLLDKSLSAEKLRLPKRPISKEKWIRLAEQNVFKQQTLFEE